MATAADRLANNLNFSAIGKATELRNRLLFTLGALIVFRLGTFLPIPGINPLALQQFFEQQSSGILGIFDTFSGGALGRMGQAIANICKKNKDFQIQYAFEYPQFSITAL